MDKRILLVGSIVAALIAPIANADTKSKAEPKAETKTVAAKPAAKPNDLGLGQRRIRRELTITLPNACVYRASVEGTVDGVREHGRRDIQLLPDLHVAATLDCPREKSVHVSRHVSREKIAPGDLNEMLKGAMSVPTGGCFYVPDLQSKGTELKATTLSWMCPSPPIAIGGGPKPQMRPAAKRAPRVAPAAKAKPVSKPTPTPTKPTPKK